MFVGEFPEHVDCVTGIPFSGDAGQLLSKMIQAMGLTRDDVYMTHVVKCGSPDNRRPMAEQLERCLGYLEREIRVVRPEIICTLGAFATQAILGKTVQIANLRGQFHEYRSVKVLPTFHPAYLLKHPESKRESWEDLKKIMAVLGLKRSGS
jgi:DNA polymerase